MVKELETVNLNQDGMGKTLGIGSKIEGELKQELIHCMRSHAYMFAWTHDDIPGIDPEVACHRLAIKKGARSVRQKRMYFNQERYETINSEVEKLLKAGFF